MALASKAGLLRLPRFVFVVESGQLDSSERNAISLHFKNSRGRPCHTEKRACHAGSANEDVLSQTRAAIAGFLAGTVLVFFFAKRRGMLTAHIVGAALLLCLTTAGNLISTY